MITLRNDHPGGTTTTASLVCNRPSDASEGDVLFAAVAGRGSNTMTCSPPDGAWTEILNQARSTSGRLFVYRKQAGASEPGSYTFTLSTASTHAVGLLALSGVDPVTPVEVSASAQGASSVTHTCPDTTASTVAGCLVLRVAVSAAGVLPLSWTWPAPATEQIDTISVGTGAGGVSIASEPLAAPGAPGTRNATCAQALVPATATVVMRPAVTVSLMGAVSASSALLAALTRGSKRWEPVTGSRWAPGTGQRWDPSTGDRWNLN